MDDAHQVGLAKADPNLGPGEGVRGAKRGEMHFAPRAYHDPPRRGQVDAHASCPQATDVADKRRLPLIQPAQEAEADEVPRPAWQWVAFGAGLIVTFWAGLALLVSPLATHLLAGQVGPWSTPEELNGLLAAAPASALRTIAFENLALHLVALGIASVGGSFVVGRWSPGRAVGRAAYAGALVSFVAVAGAGLSGVTAGGERDALSWAWAWALAVVLPWTTLLAVAGAFWGGQKKQTLVGP